MTTKQEAIRVALEALEPFAKAFTWSRDQYAKRYGKDAEQGYKNFDAMPSVWKMESLAFSLDDLRRASAAHALLSQVEAAQVPSAEEEQDRFEADADTISSEVNHIPEVQNLPDLCTEDVWPHVERALVAVGRYYRAQVPSVEEVATALEHHLLELVVSAAKIPATDGPIVSASKRVELVLTFKQIILALFKGEKK